MDKDSSDKILAVFLLITIAAILTALTFYDIGKDRAAICICSELGYISGEFRMTIDADGHYHYAVYCLEKLDASEYYDR